MQVSIRSTRPIIQLRYYNFPELGESCLNKFSLDIYMPTVVGLMSFNTMLCLFLALSSGKGVIWDENPNSRKFVSPLFHLCLVLGIAEIILVTYGTKQISGALNRFTLYSTVLRFLARKMQSFRLLFGVAIVLLRRS